VGLHRDYDPEAWAGVEEPSVAPSEKSSPGRPRRRVPLSGRKLPPIPQNWAQLFRPELRTPGPRAQPDLYYDGRSASSARRFPG